MTKQGGMRASCSMPFSRLAHSALICTSIQQRQHEHKELALQRGCELTSSEVASSGDAASSAWNCSLCGFFASTISSERASDQDAYSAG